MLGADLFLGNNNFQLEVDKQQSVGSRLSTTTEILPEDLISLEQALKTKTIMCAESLVFFFQRKGVGSRLICGRRSDIFSDFLLLK